MEMHLQISSSKWRQICPVGWRVKPRKTWFSFEMYDSISYHTDHMIIVAVFDYV